MAGSGINDMLCNELMKATKIVEKEVDAQIERYNELNDMTAEKFSSEIDLIRAKRLAALKKDAEMKKVYMSKGHGNYDELSNEKEFFEATKVSDKVVIHFYEQGNMKCKIIDELLKKMASNHLETKFVKIEVCRVPFLKENFRLKFIPTIISVVENLVKGKIIHFEDVPNLEEHSYKMLEWKIAKFNSIKYDEDLSHPPEISKAPAAPTKTIRGPAYDLSDDDFSD